MDRSLKCFTNGLVCISGELVAQDLYFSSETGIITPNYYFRQEGVERIDLDGKVVAPGFLDLHTNGMMGVHFTQLALGEGDGNAAATDERRLEEVSRVEASHGVTGWWATVPTVNKDRWKQVGRDISLSFVSFIFLVYMALYYPVTCWQICHVHRYTMALACWPPISNFLSSPLPSPFFLFVLID